MTEIILKVRNLKRTYIEGKIATPVLKDVSCDIHAGKVTAVIGRSGSGKSTLLHILGTLDKADGGSVYFKDINLLALKENEKALFRARNLGFVYQFHHLLPDFSALENVMMPLLIGGVKSSVAGKRAQEYLEKVGLSSQLHARPAEMSGGERQRAAIARALVAAPDLVLADEPTGNLDAANAISVFKLFKDLAIEQNTSIVMVTHDQSMAERCDEILKMDDGRISHV